MPTSPLTSSLGLNRFQGNWTPTHTKHLLNRSLFAATASDLNYFIPKGIAAVNELLTLSNSLPVPPLNDYSSSSVIDARVPLGATWVNDVNTDGTINTNRRAAYKKWLTSIMVNQDRTIREKLSLFWSNHFGTEADTVVYATMIFQHHQIFRTNPVGNFKQIVKNVTIDPGMLRYLNGYLNTNTSPDENYARELQELFTIGKENTPNYIEDDVKAAAKVLTGWRINTTTTIPTAYFDSTKHHTSNKQFSSFYGNAVIPYQSGANGALETDVLIDMLFSKQQEVAKFICRKLYRFFIYYTIDSTVETNVIAPLAQIFINNNWDIVPVLKTLFKSEHFFELNSKGCIIKSPIDFLVGIFNTFKVDVPATMTDYNKSLIYNYVRSYGSLIAQDIGDPPNVSGWPSYYQVPEFHELWINSNTLPKRMVFSDMMLNSGFTAGSGTTIKIDYLNFVSQIPNADDPVLLVDYLCNLLLGISISQTKKDALRVNNLLSGQTSNYYWTNAWTAYVANPNTANTNIVKPRLLGLLLELTRLPEFQLS